MSCVLVCHIMILNHQYADKTYVFLLHAAADATADGIKFISVGVGKAVNATFLESLGDYYPGEPHSV